MTRHRDPASRASGCGSRPLGWALRYAPRHPRGKRPGSPGGGRRAGTGRSWVTCPRAGFPTPQPVHARGITRATTASETLVLQRLLLDKVSDSLSKRTEAAGETRHPGFAGAPPPTGRQSCSGPCSAGESRWRRGHLASPLPQPDAQERASAIN